MLTKKHFERVAAIIRTATKAETPKEDFNRGVRFASKEIADQLANMFAENNKRFDKSRFLKACELD